MQFIPKIVAALIVVILIMVNLNVEYTLEPLELQVEIANSMRDNSNPILMRLDFK